jgi:hypothetical protein
MTDEKKLNTNMKSDGESETKLPYPYPFIKPGESAEDKIRRHIAERLVLNEMRGKARDE